MSEPVQHPPENHPSAAYRGDPAILTLADWLGDAVAPADKPQAREAIGTSLLDLIIPDAMREAVVGAVEEMLRTGQAIQASAGSSSKRASIPPEEPPTTTAW